MIQPLGDRVLIEVFKADDTKGRIIIPDSAKERPSKGKVLAKGANMPDLEVGDVVFFAKYGGTEIEDKIVVKWEDILAKEVEDA